MHSCWEALKLLGLLNGLEITDPILEKTLKLNIWDQKQQQDREQQLQKQWHKQPEPQSQ